MPPNRLGPVVRRFTTLVAALSLTSLLASDVRAQASPSAILEGRVTFVGADAQALVLGGGVSMGRAGYTRLIVLAGGGRAWRNSATRGAAYADGAIRFFLDPYRNTRWGVYGVGGLSALYDGFSEWRGLITVGVGVELPSRTRSAWALEAGLGGGVRLSLALRQAPERHR
jgi:hypothetical protein